MELQFRPTFYAVVTVCYPE